MNPTIPLASTEIFVNGMFSAPRLAHPEGVAVDADGAVWCGTERGELLRVTPDGTRLEQIAATGGFLLGLALDGEGGLYACDLRHATVFKVDTRGGQPRALPRTVGGPALRTPNFPVVDRARGCLYVSDSAGGDGPAIWRFDLESGAASPWYARRCGAPTGWCCRRTAPSCMSWSRSRAGWCACRSVRTPPGCAQRPG